MAEGVLWMRLPLPMKLDQVNIYALDDGDGWTLVDTGFHPRRGIAIWETLLVGPLAEILVQRDDRDAPSPRSRMQSRLVPAPRR